MWIFMTEKFLFRKLYIPPTFSHTTFTKLYKGALLMCTAISFLTKDHYFGRNLDLEYSYNETVTITPRNYPFHFRHQDTLKFHYAIIGVAYIHNNYPLYYDATNEKGLSMAGLHFPQYADYKPVNHSKDNITPFEFIPWVLGQCSTVSESRFLLEKINLLKENYSQELPLSPLHWMISDRNESITVESTLDGLKIYPNTIGTLTNSPTFDAQLFYLENHTGIPGDWSSQSRFVRAHFVKQHSICNNSETESVNQFFHILGAVEHPRGCDDPVNDAYAFTQYTSCCNTDKGIFYYKTYENSQIKAVNMHKENLEGEQLISYPLIKVSNIHFVN